jgi:hypothetical protein
MADHVVVAAHGHCFDGLASAVTFSHLRREIDGRSFRFSYKSCGYGPNMQAVPEKWLRGDENAIVDFRYTDSAQLTWYFDHHLTSFAGEEQRKAALQKSKRYFHDPGYGSCTKLIADVGKSRFGVSFERFLPLVSWADKIDTAAFASAQDAIDRAHPVKQLAAVVEQQGDGDLFELLVPRLLEQPLDDVAQAADVQKRWRPIEAAQAETEKRIAAALERHGEVVFVDVSAEPLKASGKFVAYALAPECVYSIAIIRMKQHVKLSIGYNPWCGKPRRHDLSALCQRHGGGGHAVVGAISMPLDKLDEARKLAHEIVAELNR